MKVITIKQSYASLIANGIKKIEFRTWKTKYRDDILIHAGKKINKEDMDKFKHYNLDYPTCCIIAKAKITDCIYIDDEVRKKLKNNLVYEHVVKDKNWQGYGFKLEQIEKIPPIYIKGKLGLWEYENKEKI